ncbi:hypothetical protein S83_063965, partial [Arachis hypogaea]
SSNVSLSASSPSHSLSGSVGFETNNSSHMYMNRNESFQVIDWLLINIGAFVSAKWIDEFKLFNSVTLSLFSHVCSLTHFHFCAKEEKVIVLVIGGEGREHALCYALQRSPSCDAVFCAPGNAGISSSGNTTCITDLNVHDAAAVISFCRKTR